MESYGDDLARLVEELEAVMKSNYAAADATEVGEPAEAIDDQGAGC
jgi:hypothetical protein